MGIVLTSCSQHMPPALIRRPPPAAVPGVDYSRGRKCSRPMLWVMFTVAVIFFESPERIVHAPPLPSRHGAVVDATSVTKLMTGVGTCGGKDLLGRLQPWPATAIFVSNHAASACRSS